MRTVGRLLRIGPICVDTPTWEQALTTVESFLGERKARLVFFVNAHCVNVAARDPHYREALAGADCVFPDGAGVAIAGRLLGHPVPANLSGTDFVPALLAQPGLAGRRVFLLGSRPGVAEAAAARLKARIPGIAIVGTHHGYFAEGKEEEILRRLNLSGAEILLVGMGVPRQEAWLARCRDQLRVDVAFAVGALLDFLAEVVPRAPLWMRRCRIEWVHRLALEPRRLWKRYLLGNPAFLLRILAEVIRRRWQRGSSQTDELDDALSAPHAVREKAQP